jgi:hypothetical protein
MESGIHSYIHGRPIRPSLTAVASVTRCAGNVTGPCLKGKFSRRNILKLGSPIFSVSRVMRHSNFPGNEFFDLE